MRTCLEGSPFGFAQGNSTLGSSWWAHRDSNPEPKDYAYHFGFRRSRRGGMRGLDHAFTMSRRGGTKVGDYGLYTFPAQKAGLGSALGRSARAEQAVHRSYT